MTRREPHSAMLDVLLQRASGRRGYIVTPAADEIISEYLHCSATESEGKALWVTHTRERAVIVGAALASVGATASVTTIHGAVKSHNLDTLVVAKPCRLIVDEAHRATPTNGYGKLIAKLDPTTVIGIVNIAERSLLQDLNDVFTDGALAEHSITETDRPSYIGYWTLIVDQLRLSSERLDPQFAWTRHPSGSFLALASDLNTAAVITETEDGSGLWQLWRYCSAGATKLVPIGPPSLRRQAVDAAESIAAANCGRTMLADAQASWRKMRARPGQLDYLRSLDWHGQVRTRGEASDAIMLAKIAAAFDHRNSDTARAA